MTRSHFQNRVVVTMTNGPGKTRRYVVDRKDEDIFAGRPDASGAKFQALYGQGHLGKFGREYFGGQWLRGPGRIDEQYRSLSGAEIVAIKHAVVRVDECSCGCGATA
jgi:hypothetical protein